MPDTPSRRDADADNASMEQRRISNALDTSLQDGAVRQGLTTQESVEFIPTRGSKVTPPKPAANPLQFIKVGPCDLYKSAQEQIKKVEEVKKIKAEVRDEAEDWQSNLDNWKCGRRKRQEHIIERVVEVKKLELEEHDRNRRRSKTFNEMMEERKTHGRKTSLMVYNDDEANDLSDLGIGTSSGDDNHSLSDRESHNGNPSDDRSHDGDDRSRNGNHEVDSSLDTPYDRAIQNYVNFAETRIKTKNNINEEAKPAEVNGHKDTNGKTPPQFKPRSAPKIEEKMAFLEERRRSSTELNNADKIKLVKVNVSKRKELFEKAESEDVKSPNKVSNFNKSKGIKERLSHLEKQGENNEGKTVNRASCEITGSIKDRLTSLERQKSTERLDKEVVLRKRLSNGDVSAPQSVKERLSFIESQNIAEEAKTVGHKIPVEVSIKERVSNLDCSVNKDVQKVTPDRDPSFRAKLANFQQDETETSYNAEKPVTGSERSSSPEDEIYATQRTQFHRSLDSLDVEDDLGNGGFERVQSLEDIECLGHRHYPPSASSTEMLVFSSQSGDTDREDSGIHTADVSSSVSQADEPVEDVEIGHHLDVDVEIASHRRQPSELSEQMSPLPPIQEMYESSMYETTTMFVNVEEGQERSSQSDDVSHVSTLPSIVVESSHVAAKPRKEVLVRRTPSPLVVVDIDITDLPKPISPVVNFKPELPNQMTSKNSLTQKPVPKPRNITSKKTESVKILPLSSECKPESVVEPPPTQQSVNPMEIKSDIIIPVITSVSETLIKHESFDTSSHTAPMSSPNITDSILVSSETSAQVSSEESAEDISSSVTYPSVNLAESKEVISSPENNPVVNSAKSTEVTITSDASPIIVSVLVPDDAVESGLQNVPSNLDSKSVEKFENTIIVASEIPLPENSEVIIKADCHQSNIETSHTFTKINLSEGIVASSEIDPVITVANESSITVDKECNNLSQKIETDMSTITGSNEVPENCELMPSSNHSELQTENHTLQPDTKQQTTSSEPKIISVSLKTDPKTEILEPNPIKISDQNNSPSNAKDSFQPVTVSGILKLELSLDALVKEKSVSSTSSHKEVPKNNCDTVVVSFNQKPPPKEHKSVKTYVKEKLSSLKIRRNPDPAKEPAVLVVGCVGATSLSERRRTVIELCERVDVSTPNEAKPSMSTPFIDIQGGNGVVKDKEPLEAVIASRTSLPDNMLLATTTRDVIVSNTEDEKPQMRDVVDLKQQVEEVVEKVIEKVLETKVEEVSYHSEMFYDNGFGVEEEVVQTQVSTNEILPLNLTSDMEMLNGELVFPLGPPTSAEPPKEKPPPPPTELSDEESPKPKPSLRRIDSTKRIKKEIRRKRSDFLGIEGNTDDSYLEPVLSVAPDMTAFLIEEQRQQKQLYRQSICSESDSNPGESRDSGVELERHVDDHWLGKQVLTPDMSAQHSRQESELYGNTSSVTSEEDEITKKEREIIEMLEKEEQWRYANTNSTQDDLGEKLAEKLRQLEQEKLQLEWDRAQEERRRVAEENARREETMRLRAMEQDLRKQETNHDEPTPTVHCGDGNNVGELIRMERERLQHEQEEIVNQRENLILRETQQLHRNMKQWSAHPSSAMSLQDISRNSNVYQHNGLPPVVPPAPLNYRLSLPDLQEQVDNQRPSAVHRAPPPVPPAKPTRHPAQRERDNRTASPADNVQLRHGNGQDGVQLRHNGNTHVDNANIRHSTGNTQQQMSRQTLQALSAAPRSRIVSTDNWIQAKKKPEAQRNSSQSNSSYNYQHWLIQEAEHRRITEQQQRNAPISPRKAQPPRDKPLPDAIIQTLTQRVQNRAANNEKNNSPTRRDVPTNNHSPNKINGHNGPTHSQSNTNGHGGNQGHATVANGHGSPKGQMNGSPNAHVSVQMSVQSTAIDSHEKMLSVSGKKKCSHCTDELGRGAAMIIESLRLFYHIDCFKCCVCHVQLGDGLMGTDVRVRNNKLHCHNCYSSDDGVKFSCV